ncbi:hypothetical protein E2562_026588 [Oryza meyeriana var. granulata]|uniref:Uncharacterized protein n=1 Tax=Oryza meyeriana var. granulata TaxID=110450 RepID=A0A6G1CT85_9ORYZ|nr:hypothetical protein E2562_026588 [Oryza meyeriana var. granulata]
MTFDPATLATFLWNPHADPVAGKNNIALPSFGQTPPAIEARCVLSGKPTGDGGRFTVAMVEMNSNVLCPFATANDIVVVSIFPIDFNGKLHLVFIFEGDDGNTIVDVADYRVEFEKRNHARIRSIGDRAILRTRRAKPTASSLSGRPQLVREATSSRPRLTREATTVTR